MDDMDIFEFFNFPPNVRECIEALADTGVYGNTPKELIKFLMQHSVFRLDDVKTPTIWGLLKRGKPDGWIIRNVPGSRKRNTIFLKHVKEDKESYPLESK